MLKLTIAMLRLIASLFLLIHTAAGLFAPQRIDRPQISAPAAGDVLQGVVSVTGRTDVESFQSAEVAFRYEDDSADTWYLLSQSKEPVKGGELARWDTTTIADGNYRLRVQVTLQDGQVVETSVQSLRVRNYTAVETATAPAQAGTATATPPPEPSATPRATPTALQPNPARVTQGDLVSSWVRGGLFTLLAFLALGLYLSGRNARRGR